MNKKCDFFFDCFGNSKKLPTFATANEEKTRMQSGNAQ
ncbi:hypothetical protein EVA_04247 [gut metagenome]|uniref:Uncharacterized protein n=1 Tax=gut metagenome TaxID=749906 RepID=J9GK27_9ZZZZ